MEKYARDERYGSGRPHDIEKRPCFSACRFQVCQMEQKPKEKSGEHASIGKFALSCTRSFWSQTKFCFLKARMLANPDELPPLPRLISGEVDKNDLNK